MLKFAAQNVAAVLNVPDGNVLEVAAKLREPSLRG
jgi:hypothetical protein